MKFILRVLFFITLGTGNSFSQFFPLSTIDFTYINRSYTNQVSIFSNPANTGSSTGTEDAYTFDKAQGISIANFEYSITDLIRMRKETEEKKIRFGDIIGGTCVFAGMEKPFDSVTHQPIDKTGVWIGSGFELGAFFMYHFNPKLGVGIKWKWAVYGELLSEFSGSFSPFNPASPNKYFTFFGHYKRLYADFSTTYASLDGSRSNEANTYNRSGSDYFHSYTGVTLKYFVGKKSDNFYFVGKYDVLTVYRFADLNSDYNAKFTINTFQIGFGCRFENIL